MHKPLIIAICGLPKSGKSTMQEILHQRFGVQPWDDGRILRDHIQRISGLSYDELTTQEGKKRKSIIGSVLWEHRKALGEYGNLLESMFGENIIPQIACREIEQHFRSQSGKSGVHSSIPAVYSCASVRRKQGLTYKEHGGIVVEVIRPGVVPTGNEFDTYDRTLVDLTVVNDTNSLEDFEQAITASGLLEVVTEKLGETEERSAA